MCVYDAAHIHAVQKVALQTLELSEALSWCMWAPTHYIICLAAGGGIMVYFYYHFYGIIYFLTDVQRRESFLPPWQVREGCRGKHQTVES